MLCTACRPPTCMFMHACMDSGARHAAALYPSHRKNIDPEEHLAGVCAREQVLQRIHDERELGCRAVRDVERGRADMLPWQRGCVAGLLKSRRRQHIALHQLLRCDLRACLRKAALRKLQQRCIGDGALQCCMPSSAAHGRYCCALELSKGAAHVCFAHGSQCLLVLHLCELMSRGHMATIRRAAAGVDPTAFVTARRNNRYMLAVPFLLINGHVGNNNILLSVHSKALLPQKGNICTLLKAIYIFTPPPRGAYVMEKRLSHLKASSTTLTTTTADTMPQNAEGGTCCHRCLTVFCVPAKPTSYLLLRDNKVLAMTCLLPTLALAFQ